MSKDVLSFIMGIFYVSVMLFAVIMFFWVTIQNKKRTKEMSQNINTKITSGIDLTAKDISHIGKAFNLTPYQSRQVVYKIYSDINEKSEFEKLQGLVAEIEMEEPFDDLPEEVKPSMIRLTTLASKSDDDKHLLNPISHTLKKYTELISEQTQLKKKTNSAYFVSVVSFVIGAVSFYFTLTSPSASAIAEEVAKQSQSAFVEKREHIKPIKRN